MVHGFNSSTQKAESQKLSQNKTKQNKTTKKKKDKILNIIICLYYISYNPHCEKETK